MIEINHVCMRAKYRFQQLSIENLLKVPNLVVVVQVFEIFNI